MIFGGLNVFSPASACHPFFYVFQHAIWKIIISFSYNNRIWNLILCYEFAYATWTHSLWSTTLLIWKPCLNLILFFPFMLLFLKWLNIQKGLTNEYVFFYGYKAMWAKKSRLPPTSYLCLTMLFPLVEENSITSPFAN
jgi:hypothetical protein